MMENNKNGSKNPIPLFNNNAEREKTMSRDEVRRQMKRKKQRKRKIRKLLMSFVLVLVLCTIGAALSFTVFFKTETIKIEGSSLYDDKLITEKSTVGVGTNLLSIDEKSVEKALTQALPYIGSVKIEKKLPATLIIKITETRESAALPSEGGYILMAPDGKILEENAQTLRENVAVIEGITLSIKTAGEYASCEKEEETAALRAVLKGMDESGIEGISSVNLSDLGDITMKYDFRIKLRLGSTSDMTDKLKRAKAVLKEEDKINPQNIGTLDLRSEPYSYFKPGDDTTATEASTEKSDETTKPSEESAE